MDLVQDSPTVQITPQEPASTPPPAAEPSFADHLSEFHSDKLEDGSDAQQTVKRKHRSASNRASAADVPRIQKLTGQIKDLERERDEWKTKYESFQQPPTPPPTPVAPALPPSVAGERPASSPSAFAEPEPKLEEFGDAEDPYSAWQRALARWDRRKEAFEEKLTQERTAQETRQRDAQRADEAKWTEKYQTYQGKLRSYLQQHPDRSAALQAVPNLESPLMVRAILDAENGPDVLYHLVTRPDLLAELHLITDGRPVSDQHVASVTAWLQSRVQGGTTGASARVPTPSTPAPRPPTPVRTTPQPPADTPPGESESLFAHQKFYKTVR